LEKRYWAKFRKFIKFKNLFDKLNDVDINNLIKYAKNKDINSKLSILKLIKEYPELLKILRSIL
jgi:hypothetical protein